ncbi:PVC-type heme-binding CxxCH protein [Polystyrenella longa]|uniref:PVC-type heme-binding CxxCH protein n=1 Tax=Polystyrenella longa TaxID=2528007 RepID=UPI0018D22177|nr:PVC-type heme-binding CxxCH protein [Polystyrenella longa]
MPAQSVNEGYLPKNEKGKTLNLDFEIGTLDDWTAEGEAFEGQPIEGDTVQPRLAKSNSLHQGEFWIGGYEKVHDKPQGTLTSASFPITSRWATFLLGGGFHSETAVELVEASSDEVLATYVGIGRENMHRVVVDLKEHMGEEIFIRLIDKHSGGWGHINFDNFRFHERQPGDATPVFVKLTADEYPYAGLEPDESARVMKMPEGFSTTVFAAEPDVMQPIAMAIDNRGRVWIAEGYQYPVRAPEGEGQDRILIFEDTDGDGVHDVRKVFAENLNLVSGIEVGFGGVWVGAAPYLLFIPDADGDDIPDGEPVILLDGWGYQDTHETLNAFIWGPDGWLYGCHGVFTHSRVGKPGTPDEERIPLNAAIWRYHPTRHEFDIFAQGTSNPWGVDFDDHGQAFCTACVIPHLYHIIQGARYQRQAGQHFNPYTYDDIKTIADHRHYVGAWAHIGNGKSDSVGGGHAHAGAMIYLGGVWPDEYRNQIIMNNIHGQRLNADILEPQGSGYVGKHGPDFLLTGDKASQMLNIRYGPDGQAYVIDWYDMNACHHRKTDQHDRTNGRIYKVSYGETKPAIVDLKQKSDQELAEYVLSKNDWYVRHARRILQERSVERELDAGAIEGLVNVAAKHPDETRRLRAFWMLHVTNSLTDALTLEGLNDSNPYVRGWVIQLALESETAATESLLAKFEELALDDEWPVVRLYLASAAQKLPVEQRWKLIENLLTHAEDVDDHNLPLMYWYAAEPLATADAERALKLALQGGDNIPLIRSFMLRRIASDDSVENRKVLVSALGISDDPQVQLPFLDSLSRAYRGQENPQPPAGWEAVYEPLVKSDDKDVRNNALALAARFQNKDAIAQLHTMAAESEDEQSRKLALDVLVSLREPEIVFLLQSLIPNGKWGSLAIKGLANYSEPQTAPLLIQAWPELSAENKRFAIATLSSRAAYGKVLLSAIADKQIPNSALTADLVRQMQYYKDEKLNEQLVSVWGTVTDTPEELKQLIAVYTQLVNKQDGPPPDLSLGRAVFAATCQRCHILYGQGGKVGPDLTGSNRNNLEYLLSNIVDPSSVMAKEYQPSTIITEDGRVLTGIVREETDDLLTLQSAEEMLEIPKSEIDERLLSKKSMMPDNQLKPFNDLQIRSLIAYLRHDQQVPLLATKENSSLIFNGRDLSLWLGDRQIWSVQDGEIVGKSNGLKENNFLISNMVAEDFRLSVEVKLVDDAGNSGIQFRSRPRGNFHEMLGYQADIGPNWWGKLYEEERRGLLWEESAEEHVNKGDWNTYTIEARGNDIKTWINGELSVDLTDPRGLNRGHFALQVHSGGPTEVRFRNFKLEVID